MSAPLDSSRPYRWPSELVDLVEAVLQTDPNNESTWIEWKSVLDLNEKTGHQHIAKHVLGFANRTVQTASHHAAGYAYLVVGAEPGGLHGIAPVDQAVLRPRIARYVGSVPRWRAEYVPVQGKTVLVVVAEPPEPGDPIHPVRAQLGDHPRGRILVRRAGSTDPADDHEIDQLVTRVRAASQRLSITVEPASSSIEQYPPFPDIDALAEAEKVATSERPYAEENLLVHPALLGTADIRTEEDYAREVHAYGELYKSWLLERYYWRLWHHPPARLRLVLRNLTEANFANVEIQVRVFGEVESLPDAIVADLEEDDEREPSPPRRPAVLGTRKDFPGTTSYASKISFGPPTVSSGPSYSIEDDGSVAIRFEPVDLRPEERLPLDEVHLLVLADPRTVLECEWVATASNVSGRLSGRFALTVAESTLDPSRPDR